MSFLFYHQSPYEKRLTPQGVNRCFDIDIEDTPDAIRTHDLQSRSLTLYPAELQAHICDTTEHGTSLIIPELFSNCKPFPQVFKL